MSLRSLPPINPSRSSAGIIVDPRTQERIVPATKRPDGTIRKELRIRPGYTPIEDVSKFRPTRQAQAEAKALQKGLIVGWIPPPEKEKTNGTTVPLSKNAKRRAKKRGDRGAEMEQVPDSWEDAQAIDVESGGKPVSSDTIGDVNVDALAEQLETLSTS